MTTMNLHFLWPLNNNNNNNHKIIIISINNNNATAAGCHRRRHLGYVVLPGTKLNSMLSA